MNRTYVVTGAASGIGAATARLLTNEGAQVITSDLHDADMIADLATPEGRDALIEGVTRASGSVIDAIIANTSGGEPEHKPMRKATDSPDELGGLDESVYQGASSRWRRK